MINKPTVIILGAGASMPYGFPSGTQLIDDILSLLIEGECSPLKKGIVEWFETYNAISINCKDFQSFNIFEKNIQDFAYSLRSSSVASVDDFLFYKPEFEKIGKLCILLTLSKYEIDSIFYALFLKNEFDINGSQKRGLKRDWYHELFSLLYQGTSGIKDFNKNKIKFINFNYDRSLEYFLREALHSVYGEQSINNVTNTLEKPEIIHVYGKIGHLPYSDNNTQLFYRGYKPLPMKPYFQNRESFDPQDEYGYCRWIDGLSEMLFTYSKDYQNTTLLKKIKDVIKWAKNIYFFGFAFHDQNIKILSMQNSESQQKYVYGTSFGLGGFHVKNAKRLISNAFNIDERIIRLEPKRINEFLNDVSIETN